ncbi:2-heptaprenyl-1,4-naphthoquinone methyltransferase [Microthyrium microscopicum]|uniref:2-heptaprenyl-1,4-naphthoquinone methyltransferase n=1 Tax=Microthyrium microscopicum TaxID=703497 RepID=A0A6A6U9T9_9PEZI|nr:2-heptaprenyl-1,4-naphthoquinone methyltransferase [Microthyrium microscopicum]
MSQSNPQISARKLTGVTDYYATLESRIGYRLFLSDARHFGYYDNEKSSAFPIGKSLRRMEDKVFDALQAEKDANILDAGCGVGVVAMRLAKRGLKVQGVDLVERHIQKGQRRIPGTGLDDRIQLRQGDFHDLSRFGDGEFDGAYMVESLLHAPEPLVVLKEMYRVLAPGKRLVLLSYDHPPTSSIPKDAAQKLRDVNDYSAMPSFDMFEPGVLEDLLKEAGFSNVETRDLSKNIMPMLWLFYVVALVPYLVVKLLGLQKRFVNTMAGAEGYPAVKKGWTRYVMVTASKPTSQAPNSPRAGLAKEAKKTV